MKTERRDFLRTAGLAAVAGMFPGITSCDRSSSSQNNEEQEQQPSSTAENKDDLRSRFLLDRDYIHMAGLLIASHPQAVREAIAEFRDNLDHNPGKHARERSDDLQQVRESAATYMAVEPEEIALTDSTTMGTALMINGLKIREDQEMLTGEYDYYSTHKSIEYKAERTGASFRKVPIYEDIHHVSREEIVDRLIGEVRPNTRFITGTWVHSATGLKIPVQEIAARVAEINSTRDAEDRLLFFLDGVHGFGVENVAISDLGCDFFSAGTHKWMFGPRGTGVLWGKSDVHNHVSPTIPTFTNNFGWGGWMSPGGYKAFEHQWAMTQAFRFHLDIGKEKVQEHIHSLSLQLKEGLKEMQGITLYTPMDKELSAGIVCFDLEGMTPGEVVRRLEDHNIIASTTPYSPSYARLTPGLYNTPQEIEEVLAAIREIT